MSIMDRLLFKRARGYVVACLLISLTVWSLIGSGVSFAKLADGIGEIFRFLSAEMLPPDISTMLEILSAALETIYMSIVALGFSIIVAFVLSFLASNATAPNRMTQIAVRAIANVLRTIPDMVWVLVLVPSYGLGTLSGTLALFIAGVSLTTRSFAEALDEINVGPIEALKATGANWFQVMARGVMPQFMPEFVSWSLFGLDTNIRSSAIIGMVGGGGLGFLIQSDLKLFRFGRVTTSIILMMLIFFGVEVLTISIRKRIL
jgi:phosphonate transport system permease protein